MTQLLPESWYGILCPQAYVQGCMKDFQVQHLPHAPVLQRLPRASSANLLALSVCLP